MIRGIKEIRGNREIMYDVICAGDGVLDCFLKLGEGRAEVSCRLDKENCRLSLPYGEKIPVESVEFSLGGNAANVAVGLKRQGFGVGFLSLLGEDEVGQMIESRLRAEGLETGGVKKIGGPSAYSTILNFEGERTILEHRRRHDYHLPEDLAPAAWFYLSSVGSNYSAFFKEMADYAVKNKIKLGFNPSHRELESDWSTYSAVVKASFALFVNQKEAEQLLASAGIKGIRGERGMMGEILKLGPKLVAVTDGKKGACATDGQHFYFSEIFPVEVKEVTGAGDAFASGFFGALMSGQDVRAALKWGMVNSASVVSKVGAVAGLLSRSEIEARLTANPGFGPKEI